MDNVMEEREAVTLNGKTYNVIVRQSKNCLTKDKLIKLISSYAIKELEEKL